MDNARLIYQNLPISDSGYIVGVAVFDLNGLPISYFATADNPSAGWVQVMFQSLGLKSLLSSSFQLQGFDQVSIRAAEYQIILSRKGDRYIGLFTRQAPENLKDVLSHLAA